MKNLPDDARILIVRFSSLGDVVKCTALPRLIRRRYPRARITFVTSEAHLELIRDNPHIERAIGFERRTGPGGLLRLARELGGARFDLVADVHASLRSRVLRALIRAPRTAYGKRTLQRFLLIQFRWNTYRRAYGKEEDFLVGLRPYGIEDDGLGSELHLERLEGDPTLAERFAPELVRLRHWRERGLPVLGVAPVAAWVAVRGTLDATVLPSVILGLGVACWVMGFDILYSCQDEEFDREQGLHSIPARFGRRAALRISRAAHLVSVGLFCGFGIESDLGLAYYAGVAVVASVLGFEHRLISAQDMSRVNLAFFTMNGVVSLVMLAATLFDIYFF